MPRLVSAVEEHALAWAMARVRAQTLALVADVPAASMHVQSMEGERHPSWILGHLLLSDAYLLFLLESRPLDARFQELLARYGPSAPPRSDAPSDDRDALIDQLAATNERRVEIVRALSSDDLARPLSDAFLATAQPTIGHHLHSLVAHEGYHAGQLSTWRRAHGLPPVRWMLGRGA